MPNKDPELAKSYHLDYERRPEVIARRKAYRIANPDKGGRAYNAKYHREHKAEIAARKTRLARHRTDAFQDEYLRRKYGISLVEYRTLEENQGGKCLLCGNAPKRGRLDIDHDHDTGRVRGLLCRMCNVGLGHFADNPSRLREAALYLESDCNVVDADLS